MYTYRRFRSRTTLSIYLSIKYRICENGCSCHRRNNTRSSYKFYPDSRKHLRRYSNHNKWIRIPKCWQRPDLSQIWKRNCKSIICIKHLTHSRATVNFRWLCISCKIAGLDQWTKFWYLKFRFPIHRCRNACFKFCLSTVSKSCYERLNYDSGL